MATARRMPGRELSRVCSEQNAAPDDQRSAIESLIRAGADLNECDKNGVTPLHHAVRFRSPAAVETLLSHGADVNRACRRSGSTALHRAVTSTGAPGSAGKSAEAAAIIRMLLQHGAEPGIRNRRGLLPIDYVQDEDLRKLLSPTPARRQTGAEPQKRRVRSMPGLT